MLDLLPAEARKGLQLLARIFSLYDVPPHIIACMLLEAEPRLLWSFSVVARTQVLKGLANGPGRL
ncbi:MAG: hypothetical protein GXO15_00140 [Crenarchaeota archaeon]|nr:hypothetical protein [Thermoproteota archaeon]